MHSSIQTLTQSHKPHNCRGLGRGSGASYNGLYLSCIMGTPAEQLSTLYTPEQLRFCTRLPKVELHAHLNGSIPPGILRRVICQTMCHIQLKTAC